MLEKATTSGATDVFITVFPPRHPLTGKGGARVWNDLLIRLAGFRNDRFEAR